MTLRSTRHAYLFRSSTGSSVFDTCAPADPSEIDESGTLPAGTYEFYVDAIATTPPGGGASASADVTLTLGP